MLDASAGQASGVENVIVIASKSSVHDQVEWVAIGAELMQGRVEPAAQQGFSLFGASTLR